ncbi:MAG: FYDLN acid domain-containing protein [Leptospiraceae bacterium]|nr:FYDLN acid domain-containing protein [Leptospiraceae bacterium]MCP5511396.1 FYDLN acid domain-containing protein [Leptospiraceae bacterium]
MVKKKKLEKAEPKTKKSTSKAPKSKASAGTISASGSKSKKKTGAKTASQAVDSANPLGKKHSCINCSTKFYDLNKPEKICPKCGQDQSQKLAQKTRGKGKVTEYDILEDEVGVDPDIDLEADIDIEEEPIIDEEDV